MEAHKGTQTTYLANIFSGHRLTRFLCYWVFVTHKTSAVGPPAVYDTNINYLLASIRSNCSETFTNPFSTYVQPLPLYFFLSLSVFCYLSLLWLSLSLSLSLYLMSLRLLSSFFSTYIIHLSSLSLSVVCQLLFHFLTYSFSVAFISQYIFFHMFVYLPTSRILSLSRIIKSNTSLFYLFTVLLQICLLPTCLLQSTIFTFHSLWSTFLYLFLIVVVVGGIPP